MGMNRQERRQATRQVGAGAKAIEAIRSSLQEAKENQEAEQSNDQATGELPKPDIQVIDKAYIQWTWNPVVAGFQIEATYDKRAKSYGVMCRDTLERPYTSTECRLIGEAWLSAFRWEFTWRDHAGYYLDNDGRLEDAE